MKTKLKNSIPIIFAIFMITIGVMDIMQPDDLRAAMDQISMPHYMLLILGVAKILGGLVILLSPYPLLKEWAYSGFSVWAIGGIAAHAFSGHGVAEMAPLLGLCLFLTSSYFAHKKAKAHS